MGTLVRVAVGVRVMVGVREEVGVRDGVPVGVSVRVGVGVRVRDAVTNAVDSMTLADLVPLPGTPAVTTPALTGAVTTS